MKKLVTLLFLCAAAAATLCGCSGKMTYPDAEKYSAGGTTLSDTVERLEIDWLSGSVQILVHDEETVKIEESTMSQDTESWVHWWLDGTTLRIKFSASGYRYRKWFSTLNKQLTVTLPSSLVLSDVRITSTSGHVSTDDLHAGNVAVTMTSGNLYLGCEAGSVRVVSTSGYVQYKQAGESSSVSLNSTSGKINADLGKVGDFSATSTSGNINVHVEEARSVRLVATSGDIELDADVALPPIVRAVTTTGDVRLLLPADASFEAQIRTTTGRISCGFDADVYGDIYTVGTGASDISVDTTSGNVRIQPG